MFGDNRTLRNTNTTPTETSIGVLAQYGMPPGGMSPGGVPGAEPPMETDSSAPPPNFVGGFNSNHSAGANFALGDGNVRFISANIDLDLYRRLGNRKDGGLIGAF